MVVFWIVVDCASLMDSVQRLVRQSPLGYMRAFLLSVMLWLWVCVGPLCVLFRKVKLTDAGDVAKETVLSEADGGGGQRSHPLTTEEEALLLCHIAFVLLQKMADTEHTDAYYVLC